MLCDIEPEPQNIRYSLANVEEWEEKIMREASSIKSRKQHENWINKLDRCRKIPTDKRDSIWFSQFVGRIITDNYFSLVCTLNKFEYAVPNLSADSSPFEISGTKIEL